MQCYNNHCIHITPMASENTNFRVITEYNDEALLHPHRDIPILISCAHVLKQPSYWLTINK